MAIARLFTTSVASQQPLDASATATDKQVSDFLTVQSLANFGAMTGGITSAWGALARANEFFASVYVPYAFALAFLIVSLALSYNTLKNSRADFLAALFVGVINSLVLAGAVVGTSSVVQMPQVTEPQVTK